MFRDLLTFREANQKSTLFDGKRARAKNPIFKGCNRPSCNDLQNLDPGQAGHWLINMKNWVEKIKTKGYNSVSTVDETGKKEQLTATKNLSTCSNVFS